MKMSLSFSMVLFALMVLAGSCKKEIRNESADENLVLNSGKAVSNGATEHSQMTQLLQAVREATARFHSTNQAIRAGYVPDDHCVSVPGLGGMGYHWANPTLVDAVFDPLKPEVVLYATGPGGNLRLVAVEYIVVNTGQAAPTFAGQPFNVGGTPLPIPHWSLHVWLYETNPSGIFIPFNPNISCP
ncbi:MAG TPA: hypothetical protein VGD17_09635 [Chitinophagaceae bacterium]